MRILGGAVSIAALMLATVCAQAQIANGTVKIGVLTDLSGGYEQNSGHGSVEAARMAAEEFGGKINGATISILAGDHQNKPDVGVSIANRWFDVDKVDMVTDLVNSAVGFAVLDAAKAKNKMVMLTSAGSADFTGKACAPDNSVHWVYDTYQIGKTIGQAVPQLGNKWFFITADYAFGIALEQGVTAAIKPAGATVVGSVRAPLGTTDFSSFVLQAQASKADVVALNNGGDDGINSMKAVREFGLLAGGMKVAALGLDALPALKSASLEVAQGSMFATTWYPEINPEAQAFMKKFIERRKTAPGPFQVGTYSAVLNYLKAVQATNSTDPKTVIAKMRATPVKDAFTNNGVLRADGRMVHDVYLVQVKSPQESKSEWDMLKVIKEMKGEDVFRPLSDNACPALAKN
ncbi:MAG TPA: ABC transporter substrate-binding protein [Beijerinckiaceae bacterium]|jgi:branched-chain amino acid transport system substrate-binding protein|nr:ABC transporter substrate-binding protein [Beijerinckiaceae bacterium]